MNGNITTAPLGGNRNIKTKPLFQYDYGQVLKIVGVALPAAYEVHFSNQLHGVATTQIGNADGVIIPDIYLTTGEPVYAWIYLHTGTDDGETEYTITIPVIQRASISDQEPTPVQQDVITQAIAALNTAVEQTAQDVQDATEAKQDAEEAAGNAYESAVAAAQSAANAGTYAGQAQSAQAASELAQQKAEEAQTGAQTAKWAAESAQTAAEAAQAGAVAARTGAETAQAWAVAARSGAEAAQHAAEAARDEITGLSATANTLPAGSQATASYADGTLTLGIPQGAKGDIGATPDLTIGTVSTLPAGSSATASITGTAEQPILNLGIPKGDQGDDTPAGGLKGQVLAKASDTDHDTEWIYVAPVIKSTASGTIASFSDGAEMPVDEVTAQINPVQDLHGYENPWPAGGGKNLCIHYTDRQSNSGITYTPALDGIEIRGTATGPSYSWDNTHEGFENSLIKLSAGTYTFSSNASPGDGQAQGYIVFMGQTESGTNINNIVLTATTLKRTVTFSENVGIYYGIYVANGITVNLTVKLQIESGSTATAWTPYANICPITGFDGLTVTRTGKNMINPSKLVYSAGGNNVWYEIHLPPDTDFVFSTDSIITGLYVAYSDADEMPSILGTGWTEITHKYNITSLRFNSGSHKWYRLMTYEVNGVIRDRLYQLELGSTATDYESYAGNTYDITLPTEAGTVYGGELTVNADGSGSLVVDRASVDLGTLTDSSDGGWKYITNDGTPYFRVYLTEKRPGLNMICSVYGTSQTTGTGSLADKKIGASANDERVYLRDSAYTDLNTFISAMSGVQLVYELATPIAYTLTAPQITTLLGQNNLWHDANGDISVGYKANTKLYIDGKIAELVAQIVNS